ncbi:hypothetical protein HNQ77_004595 [Silvibacterium bohemicum]|uniref:Uncharacterized protein n=1 Tax=Silvibacterium bohemicum TaxID=1577686 RepID=A0A841JZ65_9BACT|nr:hypothetical protein [Silvibacterium bohemicum]
MFLSLGIREFVRVAALSVILEVCSELAKNIDPERGVPGEYFQAYIPDLPAHLYDAKLGRGFANKNSDT